MESYIDREIVIDRKIDRGIERKRGIELKKRRKKERLQVLGYSGGGR